MSLIIPSGVLIEALERYIVEFENPKGPAGWERFLDWFREAYPGTFVDTGDSSSQN